MLTHASKSPSLSDLAPEVLTRRISDLLGDERRCVVELLWHLAELDRRHLHVALGFRSLFEYCTVSLRLSRAAAWRRTTASRLLARFPAAAEYLLDGRLCLSTLVALREVLEPENHAELLERAADLPEEQVEQLAASLRPRPEVKESIRRLPAPPPAPTQKTTPPPPPLELELLASSSAPELSVNTPAALEATPAPDLASAPAPAPAQKPAPNPASRPKFEALDGERYSLRMTVGPEFMAELAQVKAQLSHAVPDGNLEEVLRACFRKTLEACSKRKRGAQPEPAKPAPAKAVAQPEPAQTGAQPEPAKPAPAKAVAQPEPAQSRYVPVEVRRAVWERDGSCCAYVGTDGRRCRATWQLELHHRQPFARGGPATVENLELACRAHNLHYARRDFGEARMAQRDRRATATATATAGSAAG